MANGATLPIEGSELTYRLLKEDEWEKLKGLAENDEWIPHPSTSAVIIAEDNDDKIVGFLVAQLAVHVEPVWVTPADRGTSTMFMMWRNMQEHLKDQGVKNYFCHASSAQIGSYLERLGLKRLDYLSYLGEV